MRLSVGWAVLVAAVAVVALGAALLHGFAPASCAGADDLRHAGLYTQAGTAYRAILKDEDDSSCATGGLWHVAVGMCAHADRIMRAEAYDEAEKAYAAVLAFQPVDADTDPTRPNVEDKQTPVDDPMQCALDGLAQVRSKKPKTPCASCVEHDDPDPDDPEIQDKEVQDPEVQEAEVQEPEIQDKEVQQPEVQEPEIQQREHQEREHQEPEIQDPEHHEPYHCSRKHCPWTG